MGLLLFWGVPGEAPIVVITDGGVKPKLFFVKNDKGNMVLVQQTAAVADTTTTIYNDPNTTYSSATQTYGGSDRIVDKGPEIIKVGS